jgi:cytochrome c oxidase assembly factor CtaG
MDVRADAMIRFRFHPRLLRMLAIAGALFAAAPACFAHEVAGDEEGPRNLHQLWHTWGWEPGSLIGLALLAGLYGGGLLRLWRASGIGHGIKKWEAWCFLGGWVTLFIALVSPIHPLGEVLFSAHMTQHELLMLVAAPLMVLGSPMIAMLRALPSSAARRLGRFSNSAGWRLFWGAISAPLVAWFIHAVVLWAWHAPALFQATLHNEWIHAGQHTSFLLTAMLFWWAVLHGHRGVVNYGAGVLYLFTTAIHSGLLGALITFARSVWYPDYAGRTQSWGLSPLEDQQIGGLIMWVPACTIYVIAGLAMAAFWLRQSEQRVEEHERAVSLKLASASPIPVIAQTEQPR